MELSNKGLFVRGAISHGYVYAEPNNNLIVSGGLLKAYKLESEIAIFPRVIIDPETFNLLRIDDRLKKDDHSWKMEMSYINKLIRKDSDGLYFVDYLRSGHDEMDDPNKMYPIWIENHRNFIVKGLKKFGKSPKVRRKYAWLAEYHNSNLERWRTGFVSHLGVEY